jgi:C-7 ketoreductase
MHTEQTVGKTARPVPDQAVIVTGGGSGIGRATARQFAREGAAVLVVGRTAASLEETAAGHEGIRTCVADVTAPEAPARIVATAQEYFGGVDVLVNNAGIIRPARLGEIRRKTTEEQIATNLLAPLFLAQEALPYLQERGGTIVNVTSNPPYRGWPRNSVYGATKVALDFLTHTWAVEQAEHGIRVVSVAPGPTNTPVLTHAGFTAEQIAASGEQILPRVPLHRRGEPEEIAWWIVNAVRPEARYLTGQVIRVDGGMSVAP